MINKEHIMIKIMTEQDIHAVFKLMTNEITPSI